MNKYELKLTPRVKIAALILLSGIIFISYYAVYRAGVRSAQEQASIEYKRAEAERMAQVDKLTAEAAENSRRAETHRLNELKLQAENAVLRRENELTAADQLAIDAQNRVNSAENQKNQVKEKKEKEYEIQSISNVDDSLRGLCDDARGSGITFSFCK